MSVCAFVSLSWPGWPAASRPNLKLARQSTKTSQEKLTNLDAGWLVLHAKLLVAERVVHALGILPVGRSHLAATGPANNCEVDDLVVLDFWVQPCSHAGNAHTKLLPLGV